MNISGSTENNTIGNKETGVYYEESSTGPIYNMQQQEVKPDSKESVLSLIGLILAILSLICCGPLIGIPALICCIIAIVNNKPDIRAIAGIVISAIAIIIWVMLLIYGANTLTKVKQQAYNNLINKADNTESLENTEDHEDHGYDYLLPDKGKPVVDTMGDFDPSTVTINNVKVTLLDMSASDVEKALKVDFNDTVMKSKLQPGGTQYIRYIFNENTNSSGYFYFYNDNRDKELVSDCKLVRIVLRSEDNDSIALSNFCNIQMGDVTDKSSFSDIEGILGLPDDGFEASANGEGRLTYNVIWDYEYNTTFEFNSDGKMNKIDIEHVNQEDAQ